MGTVEVRIVGQQHNPTIKTSTKMNALGHWMKKSLAIV
jgi:hypothetical protein